MTNLSLLLYGKLSIYSQRRKRYIALSDCDATDFLIKQGITLILLRFVQQFISEIRRRKVVPVIVTYAVAGWLILQVAELTFTPLGMPEGAIRLLIIVTIAGFPAVFFLAWILNIRSQGVMFDLPLWVVKGKATRQQKKASHPLALFLFLLVVAATWGLAIFLDNHIQPATIPLSNAEQDTATSANFPANSIAVLAFENFDGQATSNYFAEGLAEEILNSLSSITELNVAARSSSFRFRGERVDVRKVAKLLNVGYVLEGSVRRDGDRVRISAQLINGKEGFNAWSKSYDRKLDDVFAIQKEIALAVVNKTKIALSVASQKKLQHTQTENVEAYLIYLQGLEKLHSSMGAESMKKADKLFEHALEIDPNFSRAYAGKCQANLGLYESSNDKNDFNKAEIACEKAQNFNTDNNSEVNIALGRLYRLRGSYQKSENILIKAITTSPTEVDAYIELGEVQSAQKKFDKAESSFLQAIKLKRNYWKAYEALADFYYHRAQYVDSAKTYKIVTRLAPDSSIGYQGKGAADWMLGNIKKALQSYKRSLELNPSRQTYTNLGMFYYYAGQFQQAADMQIKALNYAETDHRIWGRLAESYRFISEQGSLSHFAYQRAAKLARENLKINPKDWLTRAMLGLYLVHLGEKTEGMDLLENAVQQSQRNAEILYFKALAVLQNNNTKLAITLLEEAVEHEHYYRQFIALDPDFKRLRNEPKFISLLPPAKQ